VRRYQIWSLGDTLRLTPERGVSTPNGTRIAPSYFFGSSDTADVIAYCHMPLRLSHPLRTSCGRGYSRHTFSGVTELPHTVARSFVINMPLPSAADVCTADVNAHDMTARRKINLELFIPIDISIRYFLNWKE
jgi:hypothetical protein